MTPPRDAGTCWSFHALGTPAPQGSKAFKGLARNGRAILAESSKAVKPWREDVVAAAFGAGPKLAGPVVVRMIFTIARPKSARKTDLAPFRKPDIDKLARSTMDAIKTAGLWDDDAQVCDFDRLAKVWPGYSDESLPVPGVIVAAAIHGSAEVQYLRQVVQVISAAVWERAEGVTA